eukprot:gene12243-12380_t
MARALPKQQIDKGKVWVVFIGSAASLFIMTVLAENNSSWFPAIAKANAAMAAAKNKAAQDDVVAPSMADIEAQAEPAPVSPRLLQEELPPLDEESAALEAEIERQSVLVEEALLSTSRKVSLDPMLQFSSSIFGADAARVSASNNHAPLSSGSDATQVLRRRYVCGLKEVTKAVKNGKAKGAMSVIAEPAAKKAKTNEYTHSREAFLAVYTTLRDELLNDKLLEGQPQDARNWLKEMLDYNVPGGKLNRGMAVYDVLASIKGADALTSDDIFKANAVGWCIEWLQAFFLVADDIMDGSITRRGQPCWYKVPKVGMIACNDYILLECCIYRVLKFHFADSPAYGRLLDLFLETTYQTSHGQLLDLTTAPPGHIDLSRYTMDNYLRIITYKTAFYTFYLPVAAGLLLSGETRAEAFDLARQICVEMGQYFQIQDDYLDCFGDPEVIGKVGTDIEDAKCCWIVCTALQLANDQQKEIIKANYGQKDPAAVAKVKEVYQELQLAAKFESYEAESYAKLSNIIAEQTLLPQQVFTSLLKKIYKRQK